MAIAFGILLFGVFFIVVYPGANELIFDRILLMSWALILYKMGGDVKIKIAKYASRCYWFYHACTAHLIFTISRNHCDGFYLFSLVIGVQFFALAFRENKQLRQYQFVHTTMLIVVLILETTMTWHEKWMYAGVIIAVSVLQFECARMKNLFVGQIKMKEHMLLALFSKSEDAVFITDIKGSISEVNERVYELFGFDKNEIIGSDFKMLRRTPLSEDELEKGLLELETNRYWTTESVLKKKDGSEFPARLSLALIGGSSGKCLVYRALDITQSKENEQRLIEALNKAEEAVSAKSQFLAIMSHELRTPLNGVIATSALLHQTATSLRQEELINLIDKSGKSLLMLINDILDISKMENEKMELSLAPEKIDEAIFDVIDLLRPQAESKGLQLLAEFDSGLTGYMVLDVNRLKQVLFNLIGNAIKFTEKGDVTVIMKCNSMNYGRTVLHFEIKDTGIGIPEEKFHRLFKLFSQVDSSIGKKYGGTGLGLAISKEIIELMGGSITLTSRVGVGTSFSFDLEFEYISSAMYQRIVTQTDGNKNFDYSKIKLLIAEDNEINRQVLRFILDILKIQYEFAENGLLAVEKCRKTNYDIIFTDLNMPVMDGFEAARIIRSEMAWQPAIIAISAVSFEEEKHNCFDAGMNDFLPKPFELEDLKLMLRKWSNEAGKTHEAA